MVSLRNMVLGEIFHFYADNCDGEVHPLSFIRGVQIEI